MSLVAGLAGCGGSSGNDRGDSSWSASACRRQAASIAEHAGSMLLHYRGGTVYPADMSYLGLREALERYDAGACPDDTLGEALARRLDPGKRRTLESLLPRRTAERVHKALAAVR